MSQAQGFIELAAVPQNKLSKKAVHQILATLLYTFVVVGEYLQTLLIPSAATMCHEWTYSWKRRSTQWKTMQLPRAGLESNGGFHSAPASLIRCWSHTSQA